MPRVLKSLAVAEARGVRASRKQQREDEENVRADTVLQTCVPSQLEVRPNSEHPLVDILNAALEL